MPPAITATCGRKCSTPTRSRRSRNKATSSILPSPSGCTTPSIAAGGSRDPAEAYTAFRGRLPKADALLRKRGFAEAALTLPSPAGGRGLGEGAAMDLYTAGHRRGVVCAPHFSAVEAGRAILAEGGNAIEAMIAMAAAIAAAYPHMNHIGGDGFWLIREPSGRVRAIMAAGPAAAQARPELYAELRGHPDARAARGADRAGRDRRLDAGARGGRSVTAEHCRSMCCWRRRSRSRATAMRSARSQARLTREQFAELEDAAGLCGDFSRRRQGAGSRHQAAPAGARRNARRISPMPASTISIAATSAARSPPTLPASAAR